MAAESCSRSDHSIFRKTNAGFTLIELALVVVLVAFLAVSVLLRFFEFSDEARQNAEEGTAGAVISGLRLYGSQSTILGREPRFPDELDSAEPGDASDASPLFEIVLAQGITSGWSKVDSTRYRGQAGNLYVYDNEKGTFTNIGSVLFASNFAGGFDDWTTFGAHVSVVDGNLVLGNGNYVPENRAFVGDPGWTDYVIETNAVLNGGSGYGIFFRTQNPNSPSGYTFQYDSRYNGGEFIMRRWDNGSERSPFVRAKPADPAFEWNGVERNIRIEVSGNTFSAYVDGELVLTGTDSTYSSGAIGVRSWHNTQAEFDEFTVSPL